MVKRNVFMFTVVLFFLAASVAASSPEKEAAALSCAEKWLTLVDNENYVESWEEAARLFRNAVTRQQWKQSMLGVRKPLGKVVSRKLKMKTYQSSLPGAPDGEYVIIQFDTSFENKKVAVETVTPMMGTDGIWRVSGYYIK